MVFDMTDASQQSSDAGQDVVSDTCVQASGVSQGRVLYSREDFYLRATLFMLFLTHFCCSTLI